jgi:hypothetical protein
VRLNEAFRTGQVNSTVCELVHHQPVLLAATLRKRLSVQRLCLAAANFRCTEDQKDLQKRTNTESKFTPLCAVEL